MHTSQGQVENPVRGGGEVIFVGAGVKPPPHPVRIGFEHKSGAELKEIL